MKGRKTFIISIAIVILFLVVAAVYFSIKSDSDNESSDKEGEVIENYATKDESDDRKEIIDTSERDSSDDLREEELVTEKGDPRAIVTDISGEKV